MRTIVCTIDVGGSVHVEAEGFQGKACESEIDRLLQGTGIETQSSKHKAEYFVQPQPKVRIKGKA